MLSKSDSKFIKSLQLKKNRQDTRLFVTEGRKNLLELLGSGFEIHKLLLTKTFYDLERNSIESRCKDVQIVSEEDLTRCGTFQSNEAGLAVVKFRNDKPRTQKNLLLALEDIRDPGNLGTIIRIADWYGMDEIICSENCADCYNTKVINASMGSFFRVHCTYTDLAKYLEEAERPVFAATLDGKNIHQFQPIEDAIIVIGNESSGISDTLYPLISKKITIPAYGKAESLNAAIATAIICDNFKRIMNG